jgi:putative acetyltransferase
MSYSIPQFSRSVVDKAARLLAAEQDQSEDNDEAWDILGNWRASHALTLSLVAEDAGRIVGHIALSPVIVSDGAIGWYGLGPISVDPECQHRGIGRALMESSLAKLRTIGANGCVLVGDPAFYARFGFESNPALTVDGVPQEFCLSLAFGSFLPRGNVQFHPAFQAEG